MSAFLSLTIALFVSMAAGCSAAMDTSEVVAEDPLLQPEKWELLQDL